MPIKARSKQFFGKFGTNNCKKTGNFRKQPQNPTIYGAKNKNPLPKLGISAPKTVKHKRDG
uniref:Uncharacterized protein n=1 Tax=uncultured Alphaproteobacteria bacterium TaxID=91750 RepID=A0A6G8F1Q2_9PROT|nr:hypothetical protein PlAlph_0190 [uncultured Alphaproteobacteria bacterium]